MTVQFADMRDKLLTLEEVRTRLSETEDLQITPLPVTPGVVFEIEDGWHSRPSGDTGDDDSGTVRAEDVEDPYEPVPAWVRLPGGREVSRFQLSRLGLLQAGAMAGVPRKKQESWPADILESILNWWFTGGATSADYRMYAREIPGLADPLAMGVFRSTVTPFSNLTYLDLAVRLLQERFGVGAEIMADYKFRHDLEQTSLRLVVPAAGRVIEGTRVEDDEWCTGIDWANSLVGIRPTILQGHLFRWWCTNGATANLADTSQFSRRQGYEMGDVWDWAEQSVNEILDGLPGSLDNVQTLTTVPVTTDVTAVLRDLFARYNVPVRERNRIVAAMADTPGDRTMYDIMNEITRAANAEGLSSRTVTLLLALGGHVAEVGTDRCTDDHPCHRLLPPGWDAPSPPALGSPGAN